jgi:aminodeoxychorismate lyase
MNPSPPADSFPVVYHGNRFLPAQEAAVSVFDRGLLHGDGLFESLRVRDGQPLYWRQHFERLVQGARFLRIPLDRSSTELSDAAIQLAQFNQAPDAMLRLTLTRGVGPRGYSTAHAIGPTLLMTLHHAPVINPHSPPQWRLVTSRIQVGTDDPLTRFKTCNRLPYILARQEAEAANANDALILNARGEVVETSAANVFWLLRGALGTPPVSSGALPGVTRATVLELARDLGLPTPEVSITPLALLHADAVFLTTSSLGLVEVVHLDQHPLNRSALIQSLHEAYWANARPTPKTAPSIPGSTGVTPGPHIPKDRNGA